MTAAGCRQIWADAPLNERAPAIDQAYPNCACEPHSLCASGGDGVADEEILARVLTSPRDYDHQTGTIVQERLMHLYSAGMSVIRQGANDDEILSTIDELTMGGAEERKLVGAVVMPTAFVRNFQDPQRWFAAYATDVPGKTHHVDLCGTKPNAESKTQAKKQERARRYEFGRQLEHLILYADEAHLLLEQLRQAGI